MKISIGRCAGEPTHSFICRTVRPQHHPTSCGDYSVENCPRPTGCLYHVLFVATRHHGSVVCEPGKQFFIPVFMGIINLRTLICPRPDDAHAIVSQRCSVEPRPVARERRPEEFPEQSAGVRISRYHPRPIQSSMKEFGDTALMTLRTPSMTSRISIGSDERQDVCQESAGQ